MSINLLFFFKISFGTSFESESEILRFRFSTIPEALDCCELLRDLSERFDAIESLPERFDPGDPLFDPFKAGKPSVLKRRATGDEPLPDFDCFESLEPLLEFAERLDPVSDLKFFLQMIKHLMK